MGMKSNCIFYKKPMKDQKYNHISMCQTPHMKLIRALSGILILLLNLAGSVTYAQAHAERETYLWFDKVTGLENTDLFNGKEYLEQHVIRNGKHKYLISAVYAPGYIQYEGQPYFDIPLRYNVYDDLLLVKIQNREGEVSFELHKSRIERFQIRDHFFIHIGGEEGGNEAQGFYEILLEEPGLSLLKKHRKKQKKFLDRNYTYYEFETDEPEYLYKVEGNYNKVGSRRSLFADFPDSRRKIREYYGANKSLLDQDRDRFYIRLFQELAGQNLTEE